MTAQEILDGIEHVLFEVGLIGIDTDEMLTVAAGLMDMAKSVIEIYEEESKVDYTEDDE